MKPQKTKQLEVSRLILGEDLKCWQSCANYCTVMKAAVMH
jgi:hypothetical protein